MLTSVFSTLDPVPLLAPEEQLLLEALNRVIHDVIAPSAESVDKTGQFPRKSLDAINNLGLNLMFLPESVGGAPMSYTAYLACVQRISAACASTGITWATNFHAVKPIIDWGNQEQIERLLPPLADGGLASLCITEPDAGSDAGGMRLKMRPMGDEVELNGTKTFITNGDVADILLVFGKWSEMPDDRRAITAVVVERGTPGLSTLGKVDKMGHRGSSTATMTFEGCRIPLENVLGRPGDGLKILFASLNKSRPSIGAHALGIAQAAFLEAITYVNQRVQSGQRIVEFQGIQFLLADLATELALTLRWLWHVGSLVDAQSPDFAVEASMLKLRASDLAMRMTTEAVQLHGGYGYCREYPVERLMRDAKITQIWEGTNQIHRQFIGRSFIEKQKS
jgi:alkylation response protein AidB-like acyl-CoA dehydrogenase